MRLLSHYNLGLNAWAMGDTEQALDWFYKSLNQERNKQIRKLSREAIRRIENENQEEEAILVRAATREKEPKISWLEMTGVVGGGVDSNVFRAPAEAYVDLSDPTAPTVTPEVMQGFYIPVSLRAKYSVQSFEHESFFGAYRFAGRFYQDAALENGNEYSHQLAFGTEYNRRKEDRTRSIYSAFSVAQHEEIYYDRDDGTARIVNDVDIDDRFNYLRYGPDFWFRQTYKRFGFGIRGTAQLWNYEDTVEVPEYDHEYFSVGLNAQYRFTRTSLLRLHAEAYQRHFGDRPSFELDGTQLVGAPTVEYDYLEFGLTARQRVTQSFWFGVDFTHTQREDAYLGYNDYVRNTFGADIHLGIGERFYIDATAAYDLYDYGNAFAYNNPAAGRKTLERLYVKAAATYNLTRTLTLVAEYRLDDNVSNDARLAYDRNQISLGLRWQNR